MVRGGGTRVVERGRDEGGGRGRDEDGGRGRDEGGREGESHENQFPQ